MSTEFSDTFTPQGTVAPPADTDDGTIVVRSPFRG